MGLTGRFTADFSVFNDAVQQATVKLQGFEAESKNVERQLNKMGEGFSGNAIRQQATLLTKAIGDLEGATKLTTDEQKRANAVLTEAIAKYNALGIQAPEDVKKLQAQLQGLIGTQKDVAASTSSWLSEVGKIAAGVNVAGLFSRAGAAALDYAKDIVVSASALTDLAAKTGLSVEMLQRLDYAGKQAGVTVEDFAQATFKLGANIDGGAGSVRDAVNKLGLSWQALKAQSPEQQFSAVIAKLESMTNTQERNKLGMELFGKSFATIAPAIVKGFTDMANSASVASTAQVEAIDRAGDAWDRFWKDQHNKVTSWLGEQILVQEAITKWQNTPEFDLLKKTTDTGPEFRKRLLGLDNAKDIELPKPEAPKAPVDDSFAAQLAAAQTGYRNLTAAQTANLAAAFALNKTNDEINKSMGLSVAVIDLAKKAWTTATDEQKKYQAALKEIASAGDSTTATFNNLNTATQTTGLRLLAAGIPITTVATGLKLTEVQGKALENQFKFLNSVTDATNKNFASNHQIMGLMTPRYGELHTAVTGVNDDNTNLASTVIDSGTAMMGFANQAAYTAGKTKELQAGLKAVREESGAFGDALATALGNIPDTLARAFEGGGDLEGAFASIGTQVGTTFAGHFTAGIKFGISKGAEGEEVQSFGGKLLTNLAQGGISAAIGIGVSMLTKFLAGIGGPSKDELAARDTFSKQFASAEDAIKTVGAAYAKMGKDGVEAQTDLKRLLDATHVSAQAVGDALDIINKKMAEGDAKAKLFADSMAAFQSNGASAFNAMATSLAYDQTSLQALGSTAVTTFATLVAGGMSQSAALAAVAPGLEQLKASYDALGLKVADAGLKALLMQSQIAKDNPALIAGIDGLASSMSALAGMGMLNADTFGNMETLGTQMYRRLQSEAAAAGGSTKDALLPMQGFLQDAAEQAKKLGIPIDDNTQMLIDQSKELGIWHEAGKSATDALTDSMAALVNEVQKLVDTLNAIPTNINTNVSVTGPSTNANNYANGGVVEQPKYFAGGGSVVAYIPKGSDRVPAMLTPGERVLTQQQQREMDGGSAVLENTTTIMLDGQVLYSQMERKQQQNLLIRRKLSAA